MVRGTAPNVAAAVSIRPPKRCALLLQTSRSQLVSTFTQMQEGIVPEGIWKEWKAAGGCEAVPPAAVPRGALGYVRVMFWVVLQKHEGCRYCVKSSITQKMLANDSDVYRTLWTVE